MAISLEISLLKGVDRQQFVDSFSSSVTLLLFSDDNSTDLYVSVENSYLDTFSSDSRISSIKKIESENKAPLAVYPATPSERSISGQLRVGRHGKYRDWIDNPEFRPNWPDAIDESKRNKQLGLSKIGYQTYINSDAAGPNKDQNSSSSREPFGVHIEDDGTRSSNSTFTYKSKFFGENVDIVIWEGASHPLNFGFIGNDPIAPDAEHVDANLFPALNHPDLSTMASGSSMFDLATGNGDAPGGPYNSIGATRVKLRDWTSPASTGSSTGSRGALKSRYENTNLTEQQRSAITSHAIGAMSVAGGLVGGFAKKANLYPFYDLGISSEKELDIIIKWHKSKSRNPNVKYGSGADLTSGVRNPTIVVSEFGSPQSEMEYLVPVENINTLSHKGETVSRPAGGWGTNLQPFVDMNIIPTRLEDPDNPGTFYWAAPYGRSGESGVNTKLRNKIEEAWNAGIIMVIPVGNAGGVFAHRDDIEYNSSFTVDKNSTYFKILFDASFMIAGYERQQYRSIGRSTAGPKIYPFRAQYMEGAARNKAIHVAAGQNSETHPILEDYTSRGPGVDIIGAGSGQWSAYPLYEFKADSYLGNGADLDPSSSMWDSDNPYPFSVGDTLRIDSLGSGGLQAWKTYLGNFFFNHSDHRRATFKVPATHPANVPSGAKVSNLGFKWGYFDGTSAAGPNVGGILACIVEEFLHNNKRWPTPNEAKNLLLGQARAVDAEAPSTYWKEVPSPAFGKNISGSSNPEKYVFSTRHKHSLRNYLEGVEGCRPNFRTLTAPTLPDLSGWLPNNHGSITLSTSSVASIQSYNAPIISISSIWWRSSTSELKVSFQNDVFLRNGTAITFRNVQGMTELNGNTYYLRKESSKLITLYTDQNLTTKVDGSSFTKHTYKTGQVGYQTIIYATDSSGFKDSSNSPVDIHKGAEIVVSNAASGLNNGTYRVAQGTAGTNPVGIVVESTSLSLDANPNDANAVTSLGSTVFTLKQPTLEVLDSSVNVKLKNPSQGTAAGITTTLGKAHGRFRLSVDCDNTVGIKITNLNDNSVEFNTTTVVAQGTITPGEARTTVNFAGYNPEGKVGNALFFDQLSTASFDFDGNGTADALTDGLLLLRYLFGLRGTSLVEDAMAEDSPLTGEQVESLLTTSENIIDIDGDGTIDALTDGLLLLRYLFLLRGDALISGAVNTGANRTTADEIEAYITSLMPEQAKVATYGFRKSSESAVPHSRSRSLQNVNISARTTEYFVDLGDERVQEDYNFFTGNGTPVGVFQWDSKYFNIPKYINTGTTEGITVYPGAAWRWLKTNGAQWTTNMGSVVEGTTGNTTFSNAAGNATYEITDLWWTEGQKEWTDNSGVTHPRTEKGILCFAVKGTSVPNTEATFGSLDIGLKSFEREDANYYPDSNGNTVWWWDISTAPIEGSDFSILGNNTLTWALNRESKQRNVVDINISGSYERELLIQNNNDSANYETVIKSIRLDRYPSEDFSELCAAWSDNNTKTGKFYDYTRTVTRTDLAGTPPLVAVYNSEGSHKDFEALKTSRTYKSVKRTEATQGGVYPPVASGITAENDVLDIEIGKEVTKFGYNRKASDANATPENEVENAIEPTPGIEPEGSDPDAFIYELDSQEFFLDLAPIEITGSLSAPSVPSNPAVFHLGPVVASTNEDIDLIYKWQISSDGSSWTDISSTSTVYTNSGSNTLTVRDYTNQSPVGDYYRCKVTTTNEDDTVFTNSVQAVAE